MRAFLGWAAVRVRRHGARAVVIAGLGLGAGGAALAWAAAPGSGSGAVRGAGGPRASASAPAVPPGKAVVTIPRLTVAAERCQVLRRLLSAEDLLAADAARAVPGRRRLAAMVEHRNRHFSRLCRDIIRDVAAVHRASRLLRGRAHAGQAGASTGELLRIVAAGDADAEAKLSEIKAQGDSVSVADLFEMQQLMNHFSQLSEMSSSIVAAGNSTISSIARNVK